MDRFHKLYPDADEPKLPIGTYNKLLDNYDEDTAFEILCNYEDGLIDDNDIRHDLESVDRY